MKILWTDVWVIWIAAGTFTRGFQGVQGGPWWCRIRILGLRMVVVRGLCAVLFRVVDLHVTSKFI